MGSRLLKFLLVVAAVSMCQARTQEPAVDRSSVTTWVRLEDEGWWPTKGEAQRSLYVGNEACAECHRAITETQETTPMYRAGPRAGQSEILEKHQHLSFQESGFRYSLTRTPEGRVTFSVSNRVESSTADAAWAFGVGEVGQTYILEKDGTYIESRLSYFSSINSLNITVGHSTLPPADVEQALGQRLDGNTLSLCFGCHHGSQSLANVRT